MALDAQLLVVHGPQRGSVFVLDKDEVQIGRESSSDIEVRDRSVSRRHCAVRRSGGDFLLVSYSTTNATLVNGLPVNEHLLLDGDEIHIGETTLQFFLQEPGPVPVPLDTETISLETTVAPGRNGETGSPHDPRALRALFKLAESMARDVSHEQVERHFIEAAVSITGAERLAFLRYAPAAESVWTCATAYDSSGWRSTAFPISTTALREVETSDALVLVPDVSCQFPVSKSLRVAGVCSLVVTPVRAEGKLQGVLYIDSSISRFDAEQAEWLGSAAGVVALALTHTSRIISLQNDNRALRVEARGRYNLVGESAAMRQIHQKILKISPSDSTILILGESGTGKELAARAIHDNSARARGPFVVVNCALLSEALLESELFGHERGAFTGAVLQKKGKVELANGGTVFLDELGELPLPTQAKLLRLLQERQFERLGGTKSINVDVRFVAATNRNLEEAVEEKAFRSDLYFRLNVITLAMPALRERRDDIPILAAHFLHTCAERARRRVEGIESDAMDVLMRHNWPGNIRELQNALEHALVMGEGKIVRAADLPEYLMESDPASPPGGIRFYRELNVAKQRIVRDALEASKGNYTQAAAALGINRTYLHRLARNLQVKP